MVWFARYRHVFEQKRFRYFWIGFTLSILGDTMSRLALTWFVYDMTNSPEALGILSLTYTGPVILGGLFAGWLLDRFDRRYVLIVDNVIRGAIFLLIPLLHSLGTLQLWHIYVISTVYGALMMVSLAGSPAIVPDLVDQSQLSTANALETLSYTLSATVGPLLAGFLIPVIGATQIVLLDALSYFVFAGLLFMIPSLRKDETSESEDSTPYRYIDSLRMLIHNPILSTTTLMFMLFNIGFGAMFIWLPILADDVLNGGSELYGTLLGALAFGELLSSSLAGTLDPKIPLGRLICLAQMLAGASLALVIFGFSPIVSLISMIMVGFFSAPMTIWAQTLRMQIIPVNLRGRTFALLRTSMQGTIPFGGTITGFILPSAGLTIVIAGSALIMSVPALVGSRVKSLWNSPSP